MNKKIDKKEEKSIRTVNRSKKASVFITTAKVISPFHQTQIHFNKVQNADGTYKTNWKVVPTRDFSSEKHRGLLNKTYHLKDRLKGDVPSLTRKLNSLQPKTTAGKIGAFTARNAYKASKFTFKTAVKAESGLLFAKDVISPFKQTQLHVERVQKTNGKFGYSFKVVNSKNFSISSDGRFHGVLNSLHYLSKTKVQGDVPSLTKKLKYVKPKTFRGKVGLSAAKGSYKLVKTSGKLASGAVLGTERAAVYLSQKALSAVTSKISRELGQTDSGKAILKIHSLGKFIREQNFTWKQYKSHKNRIKLREQERKLNKKAIDPKLKKAKKRLKTEKEIYKQKKKALSGSKSAVKQQMLKRHKSKYKAVKKQINGYRLRGNFEKITYWNRSMAENISARLNGTHRIRVGIPFTKFKVTLPKMPSMIVKGVSSRALASYTNKLLKADSQNDTLAALDKSVSLAKKVHSAAKSGSSRYFSHLSNNTKGKNKRHNKLKQRENKLKQKGSNPTKKRKKFRKRKKQKVKDTINRYVKNAVSSIGMALKSILKEVVMLFTPVAIFAIVIIAVFMIFESFLSNSSWVLGTYTADDEQLTKAVTYYTEYANDFHKAVYELNSSSWKSALKRLGVDYSDYKHKPYTEDFIFGKSDYYNYDPAEYDFDPYILWSFLCAYNYDFEKSADMRKEGKTYSPEYWKVDDDTDELLEQLFYEEYEFENKYNDKSDWSDLPPHLYKKLSNNVRVYWNEFHTDTIKVENESTLPYQIKNYVKDGWIHYDYYSLEILNANNHDDETGWFLQDYLSDISSPGIWTSGIGTGNEIWYAVPPWDTNIDNIAYVRFVQKKVFNIDATLYYNVKQNCTFREAAETLLKKMSYPDERLQYFQLLAGDDEDANYHGNHQCMLSPVNDNMQELIKNGRIYNCYGYDIDQWNTKHCNIGFNSHSGIDITCAENESVYAMITGEVTDVDSNSVTITAKNFELVYSTENNESSRKYTIEIKIQNITPSISKGDTVTVGDIIGTVNNSKKCSFLDNSSYASSNYIHIAINIKRIRGNSYIDPKLVIY